MFCRKLYFFAPVISVIFLAGCVLPKATTPIALDFSGEPEKAERLLILLPGMGDRVDTFRDHGMFTLADQYPNKLEGTVLVGMDAHFGYYRQRQLPTRFREDVLSLWPDHDITLVGMSLGGFGSLLLARRHPDRIREVILIAPFLGKRKFLKRVLAGDLEARPDDDSLERELVEIWTFLLGDQRPKITLLYGEKDRMAPALKILTEKVPEIETRTIPGGHKWKVWISLWEQWLAEDA